MDSNGDGRVDKRTVSWGDDANMESTAVYDIRTGKLKSETTTADDIRPIIYEYDSEGRYIRPE